MLRIHREERAKYEIASPSTTSAPLSINTLRAKAFLAMTILNRFLGRLEMTRGMVLEMTRGMVLEMTEGNYVRWPDPSLRYTQGKLLRSG